MRLINADTLMGEVESVLLMYSQFNHWLTKDMYTRMKIAVRAMPTVDAVPVVRCEDCQHSNLNGHCMEVGKKYCTIHKRQFPYDFFCSYGERKG